MVSSFFINIDFKMKNIIGIILIALLISTSCKTKQNTTSKVNNIPQVISKNQTIGIVSHKFRATGCSTVIILTKRVNDKEPATIIPVEKIPESFDIDGLEIYFDYHLLKMRNPDGCNEGIPAEIINISKK